MPWLTIFMDPPPTSFLILTREKSGSMPVVSQSSMKEMVPVGASRLAWALRHPWRSPSSRHSFHARVAASWIGFSNCPTGRSASLAAACLRMTRLWASAFLA